MAKVRRKIHRVQRQRAYFDEQQWPVNLALFVLGGFLIGAAIAYQKGPPAVVGSFDFAYVGFAVLWGLVFFAEVPDARALLGIAMIVGAGVLSLRR